MSHVGNEISNADLRKFGLLTSALLVVFFVLLIPWIWDLAYPVWPWTIGAILSFFALISPAALRPVYSVWMRFAEVLGWINTRMILGLIFYVIFLPFGFVMRLFKDPMQRKMDTVANSYRVASKSPKPENMERPF